MRKIISAALLFLAFSTFGTSQNLVTNTGFENQSITVYNNGKNALPRVATFFDVATQTTNPTISETNIEKGMWLIKSFSSGYIRATIENNEAKSGNNSVNLFIKEGSAQKNLEYWYGAVLFQKLLAPLSGVKKYKASAWIKVDDKVNNQSKKATFMLTDNTNRQILSSSVNLSGGNVWTKYEVILDIPTFLKRNKSADFSTAFFGIGIGTDYNDDAKTLYSGIQVDDFTLTEE
jgi:hypothetical protein